MKGEISYDLVMEEDMGGMCEGTFRLPGRDWQVMIFIPRDLSHPDIKADARWDSGITGIRVYWPRHQSLGKREVERTLSEAYAVSEWVEVAGPDSMVLR